MSSRVKKLATGSKLGWIRIAQCRESADCFNVRGAARAPLERRAVLVWKEDCNPRKFSKPASFCNAEFDALLWWYWCVWLLLAGVAVYRVYGSVLCGDF